MPGDIGNGPADCDAHPPRKSPTELTPGEGGFSQHEDEEEQHKSQSGAEAYKGTGYLDDAINKTLGPAHLGEVLPGYLEPGPQLLQNQYEPVLIGTEHLRKCQQARIEQLPHGVEDEEQNGHHQDDTDKPGNPYLLHPVHQRGEHQGEQPGDDQGNEDVLK